MGSDVAKEGKYIQVRVKLAITKDHKIYLFTVLTTLPCANPWAELKPGGCKHLKVRS
jgi:hypothetical protein